MKTLRKTLQRMFLAMLPKEKYNLTDNGERKLLICYKILGEVVAVRIKLQPAKAKLQRDLTDETLSQKKQREIIKILCKNDGAIASAATSQTINWN